MNHGAHLVSQEVVDLQRGTRGQNVSISPHECGASAACNGALDIETHLVVIKLSVVKDFTGGSEGRALNGLRQVLHVSDGEKRLRRSGMRGT